MRSCEWMRETSWLRRRRLLSVSWLSQGWSRHIIAVTRRRGSACSRPRMKSLHQSQHTLASCEMCVHSGSGKLNVAVIMRENIESSLNDSSPVKGK